MGNIGMSELLLIFVVALLVFGAKRLPEIARGLGQGIREFRKATHEITSELQIDDLHRPTIHRPAPPAATPRTDRPASPGENQDPNNPQPAAQAE